MKFNIEKMKEISRPLNQKEREEIDNRNENRDWLALSAKFSLLIRHILRSEKMTQKELASRMGVSSVQVTKLLSGKENIGLQTIAKVEKALGRNLIVFQDYTEKPICSPSPLDAPQMYSFSVYNTPEKNFTLETVQEPEYIYSSFQFQNPK